MIFYLFLLISLVFGFDKAKFEGMSNEQIKEYLKNQKDLLQVTHGYGIFSKEDFYANLTDEINFFRQRYDENLPKTFRTQYTKKMANYLREKLSDNPKKNKFVTQFFVDYEKFFITEIDIYKTLTLRSNEQEAEKLIATKMTEFHEDWNKPMMSPELFQKYDREYINKARMGFLTAAYERGQINTEVLLKDGEKWIDSIYEEWFRRVKREDLED